MAMHTFVSLLLWILIGGSPIWLLLLVGVLFKWYDVSRLESLKKKMVKSGYWDEEDIIIIDDQMFYTSGWKKNP